MGFRRCLALGGFVLGHHHHEHQIFVVRIVAHQEQREHRIGAHLGVGRLKRIFKVLLRCLFKRYFNFSEYFFKYLCLL